MKTGIRIGHENTAETVESVAEGINSILLTVDQTHADREVALAALHAFERGTSVNASISHCTVSG